MQTWIAPIGITYTELRERSSTAQPLLAMDRIIKQPPWWVSEAGLMAQFLPASIVTT